MKTFTRVVSAALTFSAFLSSVSQVSVSQALASESFEDELYSELSKSDNWSPGETVLPPSAKARKDGEMAGQAVRDIKTELSSRELSLFSELAKSDNWSPTEIVLPPKEQQVRARMESQMAGQAEPEVETKESPQWAQDLYREMAKSDNWSPEDSA